MSFLTLLVFLTRTKPEFLAIGIDVMIQEQVLIMVNNIDRTEKQQAVLFQENSLSVMPQMVAQGMKFDLLLLDGDHNYHTVSKELENLVDLTHEHSIVIIDDYNGRWAEKDLFYADRDGYQDVKDATPRIETEKHGVRTAVDEYLLVHPEWKSSQPIKGEPILLTRGKV